MCADDEVMRYFPKPLNVDEAFLQPLKDTIEMRVCGLYINELKATGEFIGFIGLKLTKHTLFFNTIKYSHKLTYSFL